MRNHFPYNLFLSIIISASCRTSCRELIFLLLCCLGCHHHPWMWLLMTAFPGSLFFSFFLSLRGVPWLGVNFPTTSLTCCYGLPPLKGLEMQPEFFLIKNSSLQREMWNVRVKNNLEPFYLVPDMTVFYTEHFFLSFHGEHSDLRRVLIWS